jgi:hypothetical protein
METLRQLFFIVTLLLFVLRLLKTSPVTHSTSRLVRVLPRCPAFDCWFTKLPRSARESFIFVPSANFLKLLCDRKCDERSPARRWRDAVRAFIQLYISVNSQQHQLIPLSCEVLNSLPRERRRQRRKGSSIDYRYLVDSLFRRNGAVLYTDSTSSGYVGKI